MGDELKHVLTKSLECPMCMDIFKEPKILSCSHTFCKVCLERLLECHEDDQSIKCPVCRFVNQLPSRDVSQLPTNLALQSLLDDVTKEHHFCTECKTKGKTERAEVHCRDCGKYFCLNCRKIHDSSGFQDHESLPLNEVSTGKVPSQLQRKCRQHPEEEDQCFCCYCCKYVCIRCGVTEHVYKGHRIIDASVHESNQKKAFEELKSKVELKQASLQKYIDIIDHQKEQTTKNKKQRIDDINRAYEESVRHLAERKEILVEEVKGRAENLEAELNSLKKTAQQQASQVATMTDLVAKENQELLEMEALVANLTLCEDLRDALEKVDPDYKHPVEIGMRGDQIAFDKNVRIKEFDLGRIYEKNVEPAMTAMAATPDGMMAVGCRNRGIKVFSGDGLLQKTVLIDVKVRGLDFLSDGRCVVFNTSGVLSLYSPKYEKLDVKFDSITDNGKLGSGGLGVTANDQIYVGNMEKKKIAVFSPAGGKAIRELSCLEYEPHQISGYDDTLLITESQVIRTVDTQQGLVKSWVDDSEWDVYAAVTRKKTVLIAWVKHSEGLVCIEECTEELEYVQAVINEYKFEKSVRNWYSVQEFTSGEIAFCTAERLYIFKHEVTWSCL